MITVFQGSFGKPYTFQWLEADGITPRRLDSTTVTWFFKSLTNPNTILQLSCVITDVVNGLFYAIMTTGISNAIDEYETQFQQFETGVLTDYTDKFNVTIEKSDAIAG